MALGSAWDSYPNQIAAAMTEAIADTARREATSKIGQVIARPGPGLYDVRLSSGGKLSSIGSQTRQQWPVDSWVTVEKAGEVWQVVGPAPVRTG